jgi:molybdopterin/thiamine biosynthesis adenylyltransferase
LKLHSRNCGFSFTNEPVETVYVDLPLAPAPVAPWPPTTLRQLNLWLGGTCPSAVGRLEAAFAESEGAVQWLGIVAPNATCFARATVPASHRTDEFLKTRRKQLGGILKRIADRVEIDRYNGFRADSAYIFGRNMGGKASLSGKRILLAGCGTIGGFLAQMLTQSGAGADGGRLALLDTDGLRTANLGRHLLGVKYLGRNKAEACRDFLLEQLPLLRLEAYDADVLKFSTNLAHFDLVIDTTGEEAVSIALNDRAIRLRPKMAPVIFVWLIGNGAAAQSLLVDDPQLACFKCLKPKLAGPSRFRTLRNGVEIAVEKNFSCADALYVPFPVSRSTTAAALACEAALDWANGSASPRFRSRTLDPRLAYTVKDANPAKMRECPACGRSE